VKVYQPKKVKHRQGFAEFDISVTLYSLITEEIKREKLVICSGKRLAEEHLFRDLEQLGVIEKHVTCSENPLVDLIEWMARL